MTTLNARASQAWAAATDGTTEEPFDGIPRDAFEEGWEIGFKAAEAESVERSQAFSGVAQAVGAAEVAEKIATVAEEFADDLEPPITVEWLELRDWFKDQLHAVAARAREIGGLS